MPDNFTEDNLVEQPAIQLLQHELGWGAANCYDEWSSGKSVLGRDAKRDVVLADQLRACPGETKPWVVTGSNQWGN